ncbi:MAG TPA: outer membrane protein transport protein [Gammaproteobacteria bacterium]|nr:outer membrane protein transport protein [Gammaproteobacteria bacterium]
MMTFKKIWTYFLLFFLPLTAHASFIETTLGTAVINDATASYYNPAALVLLKNPQIIPQLTFAEFNTQFAGQSMPLSTHTAQTGSTQTHTKYYSPSIFFGLPATKKITFGLAVVSNSANRNVDENSILRYVQSNNTIQDYDIVPAFAVKLNDFFSLGAGINFSYANFDLQPISGFPGSNIADSQSDNQSDGTGMGGNAGFLFKPSSQTVMGFNYRSMTSYHLSGKSVYEGNPRVVSNNYHFTLLTPARSVFSINHFVSQKLGFIATVQRIQWSAITNIHVFGIANVSGTTPVIVNGTIPYYLRDTWLATLGSHYRITPKFIVRIAGTYNQSPGNPHYQIANGDSIILGASIGYNINKMITIDGSYAHAFIQNENINIIGGRYFIQGVNQGSRDAVSAKLTFNI